MRWRCVGSVVGWWMAATLLVPAVLRAQPRLAIEGPVFDFGTKDQGMTVDHVFRLLNQGTEPLSITEVKTTCGCTVATSSPDTIAPGQAGALHVTLDTLRLSGRTTKTVTIQSNDPAVPTAGVTMTGTVFTEVGLEPSAIFLGHLRAGTVARFEVAIGPGRPDLAVVATDVHAGSRYLTARLDARADGAGQMVVVETSPTIPPGKFNSEVTVSTTSTRMPTVVIPVFGIVEG